MKVKLLGVEFSVSFPAIAFLSIALLSDKNGVFLICLISSFLHEIGHIFALTKKKADISSVSVNLGEVQIKADYSHLSLNDEIIVALSGVAVNLILVVVSFAFYFIFHAEICRDIVFANLLIIAFNLLPIRFLDGGQVILLVLQKLVSYNIAHRILNVLTVVFIIPVAVAGFIFLFNSSYNFSLLFVALYLICTLVSKEFKDVS